MLEPAEHGKHKTGKRIKRLREDILEMTQREFANAFDGQFTRGAVGNWERGEGIKLSNLQAIAQRFDVDINWLAKGKGREPIPLPKKEPRQTQASEVPHVSSETPSLRIPSDFISKELRISPDHLSILAVVGDDMSPTFPNGSQVIIDSSCRELTGDGVYVLSDTRGSRIRRVQHVFGSNPRTIRMITDNKNYGYEERAASETEILGRVCGIISKV